MFDNYRIDGRIDVNNAMMDGAIIHNEDELSGARENKFWFNQYGFMYKDIYTSTYEDYAELIAYEIAKLLDIPCAEYDLAIYNGNKGVITKSIINEDIGEEMISGTMVIKSVYSDYLLPLFKIKSDYNGILEEFCIKEKNDFSKLSIEEKDKLFLEIVKLYSTLNYHSEINIEEFKDINWNNVSRDYLCEKLLIVFDDITQMYNEDFIEVKNGIIKSNNLYDIWSVITIYCKINKLSTENIDKIMSDFTNMFIFDIITSQGDRHADNWSIIKNNDSIRLAPLYDNSAICSLNREKAIGNINNYVQQINSVNLNERKKEKIISLLKSVINHANSGFKVDYEDVVKREQNFNLIIKYIQHSSVEFIQRLELMCDKLNEQKIYEIFQIIEKKIKASIPNEVKIVVLTVINQNINMIKSALERRERNDTRRV